MSRLPLPDLSPGPHRDLVNALHALHHRAGWPSLRRLAADAGCSHTTVSKVFSSTALPSWGTLELLVESLDGDNQLFHDLWLGATAWTSTDSTRDTSAKITSLIAGRQVELAAVRRHMETGRGLLLVAGEAGLGKTKLVGTAAGGVAVHVLQGSCLPLSGDAPLLPVALALREVYAADGGQWLADALNGLPAYMTGSLARLLPELAPLVTIEEPDDDQSRQRLFASVAAVLPALAEHHPLAVVLEDLHWADSVTLELFEHLVARGPDVAVVGTWRLDDPDTSADRLDWWTRVRRSSEVAVLELSALNRDETAAQLRLLSGTEVDERRVNDIYRLGGGQPLFTEQLAARRPDDGTWPRLLVEVLDRRLEGLGDDTWQVARLLGVANRAVPNDLLVTASALTPTVVVGALRELDARRLLAVTGRDEVALRHPMLAEAIRRRLVPGEAAPVHRQLAISLSSSAHPEAAEIAEHWRAAGHESEELTWRIAAARVADTRFSPALAADHWTRALSLWPVALPTAGAPPLHRYAAYAAAMDCCDLSDRRPQGEQLARQALDEPDICASDRADALRRLGLYLSLRIGAGSGLEHFEESIAIYRDESPSEGLVHALDLKAGELNLMGRWGEGAEALDEAVVVAQNLGDTPLMRGLLARRAWQDAVEGRMSRALQGIADATSRPPRATEPRRDISFGLEHTDILLMACAPATEVHAAASPALESARQWAVASQALDVLRVNVSMAWQREGHIDEARRMLELGTDSAQTPVGPLLTIQHAALNVAAGDLDAARRALESLPVPERVGDRSLLELTWAGWEMARGDPTSASRRLLRQLRDAESEVAAGAMGEALAWAARATVDSFQGDPERSHDAAGELRELRATLTHDPFGSATVPADHCWRGVWDAELCRAIGKDTVEQWASAALSFDKVRHRHAAAYCRWRAAQVALRDGQRTVAARFLMRAATDARKHLPLHRAIRATERGFRPPGPENDTVSTGRRLG